MWQIDSGREVIPKEGEHLQVVDRIVKKQKTSHVYHMGIARLVSLKSISYFGLLTRTTRSPRLP